MQPASSQALVLVTGSGRSGTSSLAGSLKRLGLHVPQPEVEASETNPRGFYEPQWVIDFHKGHLKELSMHNIDSRPDAVALVEELISTGDPARQLVQWLAEQPTDRPLLVKDPHAFWFGDIWKDATGAVGLELRWLTAVRHPAEVVGSRDLAYLQSQSEALRLTKETSNVAGWVHAAFLTERQGRGRLRSFVRYTDLLADWRVALGRVGEQLRLEYDADPSSTAAHPNDDFLEPSMRKSQLTWDDLRVPGWLREMAEEVWQLMGALVTDPADASAQQRLDVLYEDYRVRYTEAVALTFDHTQAERAGAARQARRGQRENMKELRRRIEKLRGELRQVRGG